VCAGVFLSAQTSKAATGGTSEDSGWNKPYGLLFQVNNVANIINSFQGGLGFQYDLDAKTALRIGVNLGRTSYPESVQKTTTKNGANPVVSYTVTATGNPNIVSAMGGPFTAVTNTGLSLDYLMRMTNNSVSAYYGAGINVVWNYYEDKYADSLSVANQTTTLNNTENQLNFGVKGILGVGWRVHQSFELFAEYNLGIQLAQADTYKKQTTVTNTAGGVTATQQTTTDSAATKALNYSLGVNNTAVLGVIAFF